MAEKIINLSALLGTTAFWVLVFVWTPNALLIAVGVVIFVYLCVQLWRGVSENEYYDRSGWG